MRHLPASVQVGLCLRAQKGDRAAREQLIMSNQGFVLKEADRMCRAFPFAERDDLVQEGMCGLAVAVDKFETGHGANFLTYAAQWVRQHMGRHIADFAASRRFGVRLPDAIFHARPKVLAARDQRERLGLDTSAVALAAVCELSLDAVEQVLRTEHISAVSLSMPGGDEEDGHVLREIADENADVVEQAEQHEIAAKARHLLGQIDGLGADVLRARFGIGTAEVSERELSDRTGLSRGQLQAARKDALEQLALIAAREERLEHCVGVIPAEISLEQIARASGADVMGTTNILGGRFGDWEWCAQRPDTSTEWQLRLTYGDRPDLLTVPQAIRSASGVAKAQLLDWMRAIPMT